MKHAMKCLQSVLVALVLLSSAWAGEKQVYGWELMTEQERIEHRNKMRSFNNQEERERYRMEHHEKMQQRAREKGVTLPDKPPARGKGMGR